MRTGTALIALITLASSSATAQVAGLPVFNAGVPSGPTIAADYGFANADAGKGKTIGATGTLALGALGVSGSVAKLSPDAGEDQNWYGGAVTLRLYGGGALPFTINANAGIATGVLDQSPAENIRLTSIPVGLGIAFKVGALGPSTTLWVSPRMQFTNSSGGADSHERDLAVSAGLDLGLMAGLRGRVAYDRVQADGATPALFSVGASYTLP